MRSMIPMTSNEAHFQRMAMSTSKIYVTGPKPTPETYTKWRYEWGFNVGVKWSLLFVIYEREQAVTDDSESYGRVSKAFLNPKLEQNDYEMVTTWFQQDGTAAHTAGVSVQAVRALITGHVVMWFHVMQMSFGPLTHGKWFLIIVSGLLEIKGLHQQTAYHSGV